MLDDAGRFPVSDYDSALRWLWTFSRPGDWLDCDEGDLPLEAVLICDVFWLTRKQLLARLRKDWYSVLKGGKPSGFRGRASW